MEGLSPIVTVYRISWREARALRSSFVHRYICTSMSAEPDSSTRISTGEPEHHAQTSVSYPGQVFFPVTSRSAVIGQQRKCETSSKKTSIGALFP